MPHISLTTIAGFWTPPAGMTPEIEEATATSDKLIAELKGADALLISSPMYNFGIPSALKAWVDQVVRVHQTFAFDGAVYKGLVRARKAYLALSYGAAGYAPGAPLAGMNYLEPYLLAILGFIGISDTDVFRVEGTTGPEAIVAEAQRTAIGAIDRAFGTSPALA